MSWHLDIAQHMQDIAKHTQDIAQHDWSMVINKASAYVQAFQVLILFVVSCWTHILSALAVVNICLQMYDVHRIFFPVNFFCD